MNILPKKKWHVRTKENIARVRKDEAEAEAAAKEVEKRALLAEQEARTSLLRNKARARVQRDCPQIPEEIKTPALEESLAVGSVDVPLKHVNFFEDLEAGETTATTNKEHEEEKKKEQEEYEKKVGYLTYLGQDSQELTGQKTWWEKLPVDRVKAQKSDEVVEEASSNTGGPSSKVSQQRLEFLDPLNSLRKYLGCSGVKRVARESKEEGSTESLEKKRKRKRKHSSSSSDDTHTKSRKKHKRDKKKKKKRKKNKDRTAEKSMDEQKEEERRNVEKRSMIEKLRIERMEREKKERERTNVLLYGESKSKKTDEEKQEERLKSTRKYSNQFNPEIAKQNKLDSKKKYWLE